MRLDKNIPSIYTSNEPLLSMFNFIYTHWRTCYAVNLFFVCLNVCFKNYYGCTYSDHIRIVLLHCLIIKFCSHFSQNFSNWVIVCVRCRMSWFQCFSLFLGEKVFYGNDCRLEFWIVMKLLILVIDCAVLEGWLCRKAFGCFSHSTVLFDKSLSRIYGYISTTKQ